MTKTIFKMPEGEKHKPAFLRQESVGNCCGVDWIAGFPHPVHTRVMTRGYPMLAYSKDTEENKHLIETCRSDIKKILSQGDGWVRTKANSVMMIVLNQIQNRIYSDMVKEMGFKPVINDALHDGHGHTLTMYKWTKFGEDCKPTAEV